MARQAFRIVAVALCALSALSPAPSYAITVVIDYSHDSFFSGSSPTRIAAKAALDAAAVDISNVITTTLAATTDTNSASSGGATATYNFELDYTNPTTDFAVSNSSSAVLSSQVRVFAGVQVLSGSTLGEGGPGGFSLDSNGGSSVSGNPSGFSAAIAAATAAANTNLGRGDGPTIGTISGTFGGNPFSINYGAAIGSIWFDVDTDNNGTMDSDTVLNSHWHFNHTTPVAAGKNDFYSVALHEILHGLGIGTAKSWQNLVSVSDSRDWLGSQAIALIGSGNNVLESNSAHIAEGLMSTRISNGQPQEVVMDPSVTTGTRKSLTALDLAFLRDIGWDTITPPVFSNGDLNDDGLVNATDIDILWNVIRPELAGSQDPGNNDSEDLNNDGFVNEDDVDFLLANLLTAGDNRPYGDADLDGGVGGLDYTAWRERAGTGWANGDFDGDGGVGGLDYTLWRTRPAAYPSTVGPHSGGAGFGPAVVPEPGSIVLLISGLSALSVTILRRGRIGRGMK